MFHLILTEVFFLTGMYFFFVFAVAEEADDLLGAADDDEALRGVKRSTSVSRVVMVTLKH